MKEKKNIILLIIVILLFGSAIAYYYFNTTKNKENTGNVTTNNVSASDDVKVDSKGNKENVSKELKQSQTSLGILVSSIDITSTAAYPREATVKLNIMNLTSDDIKNAELKVTFIDKDGKDLATLLFPVELLKANDGLELSNTVTRRIIDAHDYKFERVVK